MDTAVDIRERIADDLTLWLLDGHKSNDTERKVADALQALLEAIPDPLDEEFLMDHMTQQETVFATHDLLQKVAARQGDIAGQVDEHRKDLRDLKATVTLGLDRLNRSVFGSEHALGLEARLTVQEEREAKEHGAFLLAGIALTATAFWKWLSER